MKKLHTIAMALLTAAYAYADKPITFDSISLVDSVKWIDETPLNPEAYIGQVTLVLKSGEAIPYAFPIPLPIKVEDEPVIKKSKLIYNKTEGKASFLGIFSIDALKESVYQFQIVNSKRWFAESSNPNFTKAVMEFTSNPLVKQQIMDDDDVQYAVFCTAIVSRKVWYKVYQKEGVAAGGQYYIKFEGKDYQGNEEYEEAIKYGMVVRPFKRPKTIKPTPSGVQELPANVLQSIRALKE
jgi:hypothetical protein